MANNEGNDIEKATVKLPTVITIVIAILFYFGTLAGMYFKLQSNVDKSNTEASNAKKEAAEALAKVTLLQDQMNDIKGGNALIKYQLDELKISISQITASTNEIYKLVRNR
jgi:hypothetical protein